MRDNGMDRFTLIRRFLLIFLCAFILILGIVFIRPISKEDIPEGMKYIQTTADNGVEWN